MTNKKKFSHESQDARRHDQQNVAHPYEKAKLPHGNMDHRPKKDAHSRNRGRG